MSQAAVNKLSLSRRCGGIGSSQNLSFTGVAARTAVVDHRRTAAISRYRRFAASLAGQLAPPSPRRRNRRYSLIGIAFTSIPHRISILHFAHPAGQSLLLGMAACQAV